MAQELYLSQYRPESKLKLNKENLQKSKFPVIEAHGHFGAFYSSIYARENKGKVPDITLVVEQMKKQGIERAVNLDGFWDGFLGLRLEDVFAATKSYADFFINFVSVNTMEIDQPDFAGRVQNHLYRAHELGAKGIKLFKHLSIMQPVSPGVFRPGRNVLIDDPRLVVIWQTAAELDMPVLAHIGDPEAFFDPVDEKNERYLELKAHPDWSYYDSDNWSFYELMRAQENLLAQNPKTTFIIPHVGSNAENLGFVASCLDRFDNMFIDLAARIDELGRQPYTARKFLLKYADRVLFGTDVYPETSSWCYRPYFNVLETADEYISGGNWPMYGLYLPDEVLKLIYKDNFLRLMEKKDDAV